MFWRCLYCCEDTSFCNHCHTQDSHPFDPKHMLLCLFELSQQLRSRTPQIRSWTDSRRNIRRWPIVGGSYGISTTAVYTGRGNCCSNTINSVMRRSGTFLYAVLSFHNIRINVCCRGTVPKGNHHTRGKVTYYKILLQYECTAVHTHIQTNTYACR